LLGFIVSALMVILLKKFTLNDLRWSCQTGGRKMRASQLVSEDIGLKSTKTLGPNWKTAQPDMSDCKSKDMTDLETR